MGIVTFIFPFTALN